MGSLNKVMLVRGLENNSEVKVIFLGVKVATFSVIIDDYFMDKDCQKNQSNRVA